MTKQASSNNICLHFKQKGIRCAHELGLKSDGFGSQKHAKKSGLKQAKNANKNTVKPLKTVSYC